MSVIRKGVSVIKSTFAKIFIKRNYRILDTHETLDKIINEKMSVARYGDGEVGMMEGRGISFQKFSPDLQKRLKEVKTTEKLLLCIPNVFSKEYHNRELLTDIEYRFWRKNKMAHYYYWVKYFKDNQLYGDAFISRFYLRYKDKTVVKNTVLKLKEIWKNRDVVFVEGEKSRLGYGNDLFSGAKSISRILCPAVDAFDKYYETIDYIKKNISKSTLIILALGPTATAMAFELSQMDYQALDLGHIDIEYEWFLSGTDKKIPIKNKFVNETQDGKNPEDVNDVEYQSQILINFAKKEV